MITSVFRRLRQDGLKRTLWFYGKSYAWLMSPNFRQHQARFAHYTPVGFTLFVLGDYMLVLVDRCMGWLEDVLVGQRDIPLTSLAEFTHRFIRADWITKDSVVYAFGVARHIETEEQWAAQLGCTVYLFDPTPPAIEFMAAHAPDPKLIFDPIGVWTETTTLRFYNDNRDRVKNLSVLNYYHGSSYVEGQCLTLSDIMKKYDHNHIDLLKMDIEGAALPILIHMLESTEVRPKQIVGALERPYIPYGSSVLDAWRVIRQKGKLFTLLRAAGYHVTTHNVAEFTAIRMS
jgi:FkbM family methyltransferase